jgi:hypothetical protein
MIMRRLHRWLSILAAALVLYVAVTGMIMAFDSVWTTAYMARNGLVFSGGGPPTALLKMFANDGTVADPELAPMLRTTLAAAGDRVSAALPARVLRLRTYGGMAQGVIVTGDEVAEQLVFNAKTGQPASLYEEGYPKTPMPLQWNVHEVAKRLHRGDYFGLTGRWMDLLTGLAILFLTISGMVMYLQLYRVRRKRGQRQLFWK